MIGDWVGPYGKGVNVILFFTKISRQKSGYTFTVSFPNPGDGIQGFTIPDSEFGCKWLAIIA